MMFAKVEQGVVVQTQPYEEDGFVEAPEDVVPGMIVTNGEFTLPPPAEVEPESYRLYKSVFIRRLTSGEAEVMENVLAGSDAKLRLMFNSVEYFVSDDPLFETLIVAVGSALGEGRATELLAPETA